VENALIVVATLTIVCFGIGAHGEAARRAIAIPRCFSPFRPRAERIETRK